MNSYKLHLAQIYPINMGFLAKFWGINLQKLKKSIRNNALRIALVEALIRASKCEHSEICSCDGCVGLTHLSQFIGLDFPISGDKGLLHLDPTLVGSKETDALGVLSIQHRHQQFLQQRLKQLQMQHLQQMTRSLLIILMKPMFTASPIHQFS